MNEFVVLVEGQISSKTFFLVKTGTLKKFNNEFENNTP